MYPHSVSFRKRIMTLMIITMKTMPMMISIKQHIHEQFLFLEGWTVEGVNQPVRSHTIRVPCQQGREDLGFAIATANHFHAIFLKHRSVEFDTRRRSLGNELKWYSIENSIISYRRLDRTAHVLCFSIALFVGGLPKRWYFSEDDFYDAIRLRTGCWFVETVRIKRSRWGGVVGVVPWANSKSWENKQTRILWVSECLCWPVL